MHTRQFRSWMANPARSCALAFALFSCPVAAQEPGQPRGLPVPPTSLPGPYRQAVLDVISEPTIAVASNEQTFRAMVPHYMWMLDHPDRVSKAWRRLGVPALDIARGADGQNRWRDGEGTELIWRKVAHGEHGLVWYAHGKANPGRLLPVLPARAVAVLWHQAGKGDDGTDLVRHRLDLYVQTDSTAASLVTRILGPTAPRIARDGADQLLTFFSGIARFLHDHPGRAAELLAD